MFGAGDGKPWPTWLTVIVVLLVIFFVVPLAFMLFGVIAIATGIARIGEEGFLIKPIRLRR